MKVLIVRFSSIGDIVLTTPVIRCVREQIPGVELHYVTKKSFKSILENDTYIDKIHYLEDDLNDLIARLKLEKYDYVIDLHKNLRTLRLKLALGAKSYSFDKLNFKKWLLVNLKIQKMPPVHIVDRYMETVKALGVKNDQKGLHYFIPAGAQVDLSKFGFTESRFVAFAIGGQHATKKLPNHKIIDICSQQKFPVILIGGKEDESNGALVASGVVAQQVLNLCGRLNLNESASVLNQSEFVISHDTGMMHVAAALKKKVFAIWGNTVPEFGMYPYLTEHINIENKDIGCRPCSKIGFDQCPKKHFKCMNDLNISEIF